MPDLLTHYAFSYLISTRFYNYRRSLLIALIGLLPDIDAFIRIHRWVTHSVIFTGLIWFLMVAVLYKAGNSGYKLAILGYIIYTLHVIMDLLNWYTPILWPVTQAEYFVNLELYGIVSEEGIKIVPILTSLDEPVNFIVHAEVSGQIISGIGIAITIGIIIFLTVEYIIKRNHSV